MFESNQRIPYAGVPVGNEQHFDAQRKLLIQRSLSQIRSLKLESEGWACELLSHFKSDGLEKYGPVLVTGSSGLLGRMMVLALRELGYETVGLDVYKLPGIEYQSTDVIGSVECKETIRRALVATKRGNPCRSIVHTAALHAPNAKMHSEEQFESVNVNGTVNIVQLARETQGIPGIVYSSTTSMMASDAVRDAEKTRHVVLGEEPLESLPDELHSQEPVRCERPSLAPRNKYGRSKYKAESYCKQAVNDSAESSDPFSVFAVRCSRFFVEEAYRAPKQGELKIELANWKVNELLSGTRASLLDMALVHLAALQFVHAQKTSTYKVALVAAPSPLVQNVPSTSQPNENSPVAKMLKVDEVTSAPQVQIASAQQVQTASAQQVQTASAQQVQTASAQQVQTASAPQVQTASIQQQQTTSAQPQQTTQHTTSAQQEQTCAGLELLKLRNPVLAKRTELVFSKLKWQVLPRVKRTYVANRVQKLLGWVPQMTFEKYIEGLEIELNSNSTERWFRDAIF